MNSRRGSGFATVRPGRAFKFLERLEERLLLAGFDVYNPIALSGSAADRYAIPTAFRWNGDGNWDMLVGEWGSDGLGHVRLYLNNGTNASPNLVFDSNLRAGMSVISLACG